MRCFLDREAVRQGTEGSAPAETGRCRSTKERERNTMGNVILIGFMGCGKSSVALKLSYRMKQSVTDTDKWIERKQGKTITEIFAQDGEEAFRAMETECLKSLKESAKNQIISVGGGMPVREENRALMKEIGKVVYLRAKPETIYERVKEDKERPLLQCENPLERIQTLLEERKGAYEEAADLIVDVDDKNFVQILFEIEKGLRPAPRYGRPGFEAREGYGRAGLEGKEGFGRPAREFKEGFGRMASGFREGFGHNSYERAEEKRAAWEAGEGLSRAAFEAKEKEEMRTAESQEKRLKKLLVINGPNLNFLGIREKGIYGTKDYNYLLDMIARKGIACRAQIDVFQSNHEGAIIDRIQAAYFDGTEGIVINPGAYTHYSYAIRDALASITVPKVEVHISNIMEREEFRKVSVTAPSCDKQIYGHGLEGYLEAIDFILVREKES